MEQEKIIQVFEESLKELYLKDSFLIEHRASERSIIADFSCILKQSGVFSDYIIDVEYNREGMNNDPKRNEQGIGTTADLIIHKSRGDVHAGNLLYLEAKTYYNNSAKLEKEDINAIVFFMKKFQYQYGIFLYLGKIEQDLRVRFFIHSESGIQELAK